MPDDPGTPRGDLQLVIDALARALVVIIGGVAVFVLAFLADYVAVRYTHH